MNESVQNRQITGGVEAVPGLVHHTLTVCAGPISVYEAGSKDKPVVVMLHGAMYDEARFIWDQMFPFLSADYHVFAIDTPRHGGSRPWTGELDRPRLMEILRETFAQLKLNRFSLVGLSMGGSLSIEYASLYPDDVRSMVLFEPGGLGETVDGQFFTWVYIHTPGMLKMLSHRYVKMGSSQVEKLLNSIYVGGSKPTDPQRLTAILMDEIKGKFDCAENDMDDWQMNCIAPFKLKWTLLDRIPLIHCPTLWLRGGDSVLVKQSEMERAVQLAKSGGSPAKLVVVPHAGHILPLERPGQANKLVKDFLDKTSQAK